MWSLGVIVILVLLPCCQSTTISTRLTGGSTPRNGFIQVMINGTWAYLCDTHNHTVSNLAMDATCKQLGYASGLPVPGTSLSAADNVRFWRSDIECRGEDMDLNSCSNTGFQLTSTCPRDISQTSCLTLGHFNGETQKGFLYIYRNNSYWTLCSSEFGSSEAHAFCKGNGYTTGSTNKLTRSPTSQQPTNDRLPAFSMMKTSFSCDRDDDDLNHCSVVPSNCQAPYFPALVFCSGRLDSIARVNNPKPSQDYSTSYGQLLMYGVDFSYNVVCADQFGDAEARVACRDAGFKGVGKALPPYYRLPSISIWKLWRWSYTCNGDEARLADCVNASVSRCPIEKGFVGVACDVPQTVQENSTRILPSGKVEVFSSGIWNPVSSVFWGKIGADVVCKREGFDGGEAYRNDYDQSVPYESNAWKVIYSCSSEGHECQVIRDEEELTIKSSSVAMVTCYNNDSSIVYSLDGGAKNYGFVVITKDGHSGYVANLDPGYAVNYADATCRRLGYYSGDPFTIASPILKDFNTTRVIHNCYHGYPFLHRCSGFQWGCPDSDKTQCQQNLISVYCYGKLKLGTGFVKSSGLVLSYKYNNYFTLCADNFKKPEADLVCKKLGFPRSKRILGTTPILVTQDYFRRFGFRLECPAEAEDYGQCKTIYSLICKTGNTAVACDDGVGGVEEHKAQLLLTLLSLGLVISLTF